MLVTLALTSLIATLLWQAVQQAARVEAILQRAGFDGQLLTVRREWVRDLVRSATVEMLGAERTFVGTTDRVRLVSGETLGFAPKPSRSLEIRIEADVSRNQRRLVLADETEGGANGVPKRAVVELLRWGGSAGAIRYFNDAGQWVDQWPAEPQMQAQTGNPELDLRLEALAKLPRLPRFVWLEMGADAGGPLIVEVAVTQAGRPRLSAWELQ
jgi:hypothetical protein